MKKNKKKKLKKQEIREQEQTQKAKSPPKKPKGRVCLFVDTENVGVNLPEKRVKNTEIYFYRTRNSRDFSLPDWSFHESFHMLDTRFCGTGRKNELDFIVLSDMAARIAQDSKKRRKKTCYFLLSRDKGYDAALRILSLRYPKARIKRIALSVKDFCSIIPATPGLLVLPDFVCDNGLELAAYQSTSYADFRKKLTKSQRQRVRLYPKPAFGAFWIEKDFFAQKLRLLHYP